MQKEAPQDRDKEAKITALIIDDDVSEYRVLSSLAKKHGINEYAFHWAKDSGEAIGLIGNRVDFDLVAVKYNLGDENGCEVIRRLRRSYPNIAYMLISDRQDPKICREGIGLGATHFVCQGKNCGLYFDSAAQCAVSKQKQYNSLKMSNASKNKLMSLLAHDIGDPLSSIYSLLSSANVKLDRSQSELKDMIEAARHSSSEALMATNELLDWGKSADGALKPRMDMVNADHCIRHAVEFMAPTALEGQVDINVTPSVGMKVYADERMLSVVLRNLVSEAVKLSLPNNAVRICTGHKHLEMTFSIAYQSDPGKASLESARLGMKQDAYREEAFSSGIAIGSHILESMGSALMIDAKREGQVNLSFSLPLEIRESCLAS